MPRKSPPPRKRSRRRSAKKPRCAGCGKYCRASGECRRCTRRDSSSSGRAEAVRQRGPSPAPQQTAASISGLNASADPKAAETTSETTSEPVAAGEGPSPSGDPDSCEQPLVGSLAIPGKNGGWLRYGGTNRGGPGRPRDIVRKAALKAYDERIPALEAIADREAMDFLPTKEGVVAVPPRCDTVIRAMAELRTCAGVGSIPEKPRRDTRRLLVIVRPE
jgi:hypothetical protein